MEETSTSPQHAAPAPSKEEVEARKQARAELLYDKAVAQQRRLREKADREAAQGATFSPDLAASSRTYKGAVPGRARGSEGRGKELYERAKAQQRRLQEKREAAAEAERPAARPTLVAKSHATARRREGSVFDKLHRTAAARAEKLRAKADAEERAHTFKPKTNKSRAYGKSVARPAAGKGVSSSLYNPAYLEKRKKLEEEKVRRELEGCTFSPLLVNGTQTKGRRKSGARPVTAPAGGATSADRPKPKARKELFERLHKDAAASQAKLEAKRMQVLEQEKSMATFKPDLSLTADAAHAQFAAAARARTSGNIWHERLFEDAAKLADKRRSKAEAAEEEFTFKPDVGRLPQGVSRAAAEAGSSDDLFDRLYQEGKTRVEARRVARDSAEPAPSWDSGLRDPTVSDRAPSTLPVGSSDKNAELYNRLYAEAKERQTGPDRSDPSWEGGLRDDRAPDSAGQHRGDGSSLGAADDPAAQEHYDQFYSRLYQDGKAKLASIAGGPSTPRWEGMLRDSRSDIPRRPSTSAGSDAQSEFYERLFEEGKRKAAMKAETDSGPEWSQALRVPDDAPSSGASRRRLSSEGSAGKPPAPAPTSADKPTKSRAEAPPLPTAKSSARGGSGGDAGGGQQPESRKKRPLGRGGGVERTSPAKAGTKAAVAAVTGSGVPEEEEETY